MQFWFLTIPHIAFPSKKILAVDPGTAGYPFD